MKHETNYQKRWWCASPVHTYTSFWKWKSLKDSQTTKRCACDKTHASRPVCLILHRNPREHGLQWVCETTQMSAIYYSTYLYFICKYWIFTAEQKVLFVVLKLLLWTTCCDQLAFHVWSPKAHLPVAHSRSQFQKLLLLLHHKVCILLQRCEFRNTFHVNQPVWVAS